jgi:hypothetical protein
MKITRKMLLITIASMGVFIIVYSLIRHFAGMGLGEKAEKLMMDIIIFGALGLFIYNRKLAGDEKKEREAAIRAEEEKDRLANEGPDEADSDDNKNLPHWERKK